LAHFWHLGFGMVMGRGERATIARRDGTRRGQRRQRTKRRRRRAAERAAGGRVRLYASSPLHYASVVEAPLLSSLRCASSPPLCSAPSCSSAASLLVVSSLPHRRRRCSASHPHDTSPSNPSPLRAPPSFTSRQPIPLSASPVAVSLSLASRRPSSAHRHRPSTAHTCARPRLRRRSRPVGLSCRACWLVLTLLWVSTRRASW